MCPTYQFRHIRLILAATINSVKKRHSEERSDEESKSEILRYAQDDVQKIAFTYTYRVFVVLTRPHREGKSDIWQSVKARQRMRRVVK